MHGHQSFCHKFSGAEVPEISLSMAKARDTKPDAICVDDLKSHVLRGLESLHKGQFATSYGLKDSVDLLKPEKVTDNLPKRQDKNHPFNRFIVAVATEISKELGIAKKKKGRFVREMEDKLYATRDDWAILLNCKKNLPRLKPSKVDGTEEDVDGVKEGPNPKTKKNESVPPKNEGVFLSEKEMQVNMMSPKSGKTSEDSNLSSGDNHSDRQAKASSTRTTAKRKTKSQPNSDQVIEKNGAGETKGHKEERKNTKGDLDSSSKRRKTKVSSDKKDGRSEAQSGHLKEEDGKSAIPKKDPSKQKEKEEFEAEKDRILELLSDSIKTKFGLVCLAKWGKETLPALVLSPYSVAPGRVRREWFASFTKGAAKKGCNMKNLVYWYGSYTNPKEAFSFLPTTHIVTVEEGSSTHATANKIIDGSSIGGDKELESRVRDEIFEDLMKLPEERRGFMGPFQEKYEKASDDDGDVSDLAVEDECEEDYEDDFDYEDESDGDSGNDSDYK